MLATINAAIALHRTVLIVYQGHARIVDPIEVDSTHLLAWCCHRQDVRSFLLRRIEAARVWRRIQDLGPDLGPPMEIDMTSQLSGQISAAALDLVELTNRIDAMTPHQQGEVYTKVRAFRELALSLVEAVDAALLEQCEMGREPVIERADGLHRLYAAPDRTVKCRDPKATLAALLEQHGPDVAAQALASGAFKQAACKPLLGAEWPNHFEVIERAKLAEGGAPKRRLTVARNAEEVIDTD